MEDYKAWVPSQYLAQYYTTKEIAEDERGILKFIGKFFSQLKSEIPEMIEIGCGPTIHHAIPFVPYVGKIYMADYLQANLSEIEKVIDNSPGAHDWMPYLNGIMEMEGADTSVAIQERGDAFRAKLAGLLPCDVMKAGPLGAENLKKFPLVTSFYCLECVSQSKEIWAGAMENVLGLVEPGGWVILSALRNADKYLVCGKEFPAANINEHDLRQSLESCGFQPASVNIEVCPCEWGEEGFGSVLVCCAQKEG
jgi:hypothetical protein